ncbi:ATP-binding protein [Actinoplanes sp. CA-252034]|uniref:ATP-binding protein n=1 Tax=Actinoplanes sp. CA-252034 TaxID=3239906 RepID=UPI003D987F23
MAVDVAADASTTVVEMTVHGQWSPELGRQVDATLRECLAGPVSVVIVDLHGVGDLHGVSRPFWVTAARTAQLGPRPARLALCLPTSTMLDYRLRHGDRPPALVFATMQLARQSLAADLPRGFRMQARLRPHPISVVAARDLVVRACDRWQLRHLQDDATLIVSELASNAVQHAGTDLVVTVVRTGPDLLLAVRDSDTRYPRLREPTAGESAAEVLHERGRGLQLVHAVAPIWGAMPARGGKVVWATVSPDS